MEAIANRYMICYKMRLDSVHQDDASFIDDTRVTAGSRSAATGIEPKQFMVACNEDRQSADYSQK